MLAHCKNKKTTAFFLTLISGALASCATVYQPPKANEPKATIRGYHNRTGVFTWIDVKIDSIDNQSPGLQFSTTSALNIYPGHHKITAITDFSRGAFSSGPYSSISDVTADFKPFENYSLKAKVDGSVVMLWVENSKGERVSAVTSSSYQTMPTRTTIFIPAGR